MAKKQKFLEGSYVKINISNEKFLIGRLLPEYNLLAFDRLFKKGDNVPAIDEIDIIPPLFYIVVRKGVVTNDNFEIVGYKKVREQDVDKIPPSFWQDYFNFRNCTITQKGETRRALPEECIGLENSAAWEADSIIERIEDYYTGKKNFDIEQLNPILSPDDIRYMPPPGTLKWDEEKREFYREDLLLNNNNNKNKY